MGRQWHEWHQHWQIVENHTWIGEAIATNDWIEDTYEWKLLQLCTASCIAASIPWLYTVISENQECIRCMQFNVSGQTSDQWITYAYENSFMKIVLIMNNRFFSLVFIHKFRSRNSVHANRMIPSAEVILVEQPYVSELVNTRVQCIVCQDSVVNLISYVWYFFLLAAVL